MSIRVVCDKCGIEFRQLDEHVHTLRYFSVDRMGAVELECGVDYPMHQIDFHLCDTCFDLVDKLIERTAD